MFDHTPVLPHLDDIAALFYPPISYLPSSPLLDDLQVPLDQDWVNAQGPIAM